MPLKLRYECSDCHFDVEAWDSYLYVIDDRGKKIPCTHPGERHDLSRTLGIDESEALLWLIGKPEGLFYPTRKLLDARVGADYACLCMDCLATFYIDIHKERRVCPKCGGTNIRRIVELGGCICPKCKSGKIGECDILEMS